MLRLWNLILFELRKILNNKKAFLFLIVLNITPIIASLALLIAYISCKSLGLGDFQFLAMKRIIQAMFTSHFTIFGYTAPFFLALIVGDSFSTEFGRGYMKTLLLTPVRRWQVIVAKTSSIIIFLLIAVLLGGFILQADLFIARAITQPSGVLPNPLQEKLMDTSISMVSVSSAFQLLVITFVANLMMIGFFIVFSMFFESAILMTFCSIGSVMAIHVFYLSAFMLKELVKWFGPLEKLCFTRHFTDLFSLNIIQNVLDGSVTILSEKVLEPMGFSLLWAVIFYVLAVIIFSRKQVLH